MFKPVIDEFWELEAIQKFNENYACPVRCPETPHMVGSIFFFNFIKKDFNSDCSLDSDFGSLLV